MKAMIVSLMLSVLGMVAASAPASAQEWWDKIISEGKRASVETTRPSSRSARAARSSDDEVSTRRSTRTARAAAQSEDDGSRPQRRTASAQRATRSVTSGGETGIASYYWQPQALASGGRFNPDAMTAAHKTLPFGTRVRVTRADNGNSVEVVINDRGPYVGGRIIDLSRRAAQSLGITGQGLARVSVSVL